jgi:hypothetical protein
VYFLPVWDLTRQKFVCAILTFRRECPFTEEKTFADDYDLFHPKYSSGKVFFSENSPDRLSKKGFSFPISNVSQTSQVIFVLES